MQYLGDQLDVERCLGMNKSSGPPFFKHGSTFILSSICNHMPSKVWDELTYPFPNFNGCTVEVFLEWISSFILHIRMAMSNYIPHIIMDVITFFPPQFQFNYVREACPTTTPTLFTECSQIRFHFCGRWYIYINQCLLSMLVHLKRRDN